ncbi:polyketide synthase [Pedobacter cryotolerans]|uniref:Amino acid adenylation domain-containing protein n=1 Tax=Pedobacter cryotolerans TaxID=2571270 RepID=A0A4U1C5V9_9SPHI|nr:polyketide synthase [Pedobacter cryotolerans]TKB99643.1 amino acid adenylation domain-containing protein [Pedobacter cryotolerans]
MISGKPSNELSPQISAKTCYGPSVPYPIGQTLNDLLINGALKNDNSIALVYGGLEMTYATLHTKSNQLAHHLLELGACNDALVGVFLAPGFNMVVGILGILKAGAAYVPIDPNFPADRINYLLEDTGMKICLIDHTALPAISTNIIPVNLNKDLAVISAYPTSVPHTNVNDYSLAYVIYTSGSTGLPKGVMIEHRNIVNYLLFSQSLFTDQLKSGTYFYMPFTFDASITALFLPLITGKKIVISTKTGVDIFEDPNLIAHAPYDFIKITPAHLGLLNLKYGDNLFLTNKLVVGGEELKPENIVNLNENQNLTIYNEYGPTECTIGCTFYAFSPSGNLKQKIAIGTPFANTTALVLGDDGQPKPIGESGELHIGGAQVARGYINKPDLTGSRFIESNLQQGRLYKTGDICAWQADGNLSYLGRADDQVKIRGYRIELGEVEISVVNSGLAKACTVIATDDGDGGKRLVAFYVPNNKDSNQQKIRTYLQEHLPDYMVPQLFVTLSELPLTKNGKVDKKALLVPDASMLLSNAYVHPKTEIEKNVAAVWKAALHVNRVGTTDNFFELGGNSLMAKKVLIALRELHQYAIPVTKLYQSPTIQGLTKFLTPQTSQKQVQNQRELDNNAPIAVIGMAGRFPGANNINELWDVLINGKETTTFFKPEEIAKEIPDELKNDPFYVNARGIIDQADHFDPAFFGINPKLAALMDPQQRIFLEIAHEALEKTGHLHQNYTGKIGVFAGAGTNTYYENNVLAHPDLIENQGKLQVHSVNEKDYIASRTAYHLNLHGPAVSVNSACSTSLLAIAEAVNSLRAGQCDAALAGGASITSPINSGHLYQEGSILSADGHCAPFNNEATGTVFSDGAGVVLLKTLSTAQQDRDHIYAIIKGVGVNNDGAGKGSFTAPSSSGQAHAISEAIANAGVDPSEITYIEAHGTGTPIGDPIEFEGLTTAFGEQNKNQYCAIGAIKSNFGHLTQAAGVAGFIKTCLALANKVIPPTLGYKIPNQHIDFVNSPFYVNTKLANWNDDKRIAGVSSFGVGGTNVHVVLEAYENPEATPPVSDKPFQLIAWSANSEDSLDSYRKALGNYLQDDLNPSLAAVAYTLYHSKADYKHRAFTVAVSSSQLGDSLLTNSIGSFNPNLLREISGEIVFTFPGQGAQYLNMGWSLYENEPIYRAAVDECALILTPYLKLNIKEIIFAKEESDTAVNLLKETKYTQPALFVTEYALAQLWISWGINPTLLCGHSVGEYVAAHLAGIFSLIDALKLVATRGALISDLPKGSMLSVRAEAAVVNNLLTGDLSIAAINSQKLVVVAGPTAQIERLAKQLSQKEIINKPLFTSHAFHSAMMDPVLDDYQKIVAEVKLNKPNIPVISTVTGKILSDSEAISIAYWTAHLRKPVLFLAAISTALSYHQPLFLEVGPGLVTSSLIKQIAAFKGQTLKAISSLDPQKDALESILNTLGHLWANGISVDWKALCKEQSIIDLPTYQFERQKYWLEPKPTQEILTQEIPSPIIPVEINAPKNYTHMRIDALTQQVKKVLEDASGIDMNDVASESNFLEIGFDSLLLTQVATSIKRQFNLPITFRQLNEEFSSIASLVAYLDKNLPQSHFATLAEVSSTIDHLPNQSLPAITTDNSALGLIAQQLNILSKQVMLMQGQNPNHASAQINPTAHVPIPVLQTVTDRSSISELSEEEKAEIKKPFGATPKIERLASTLNDKQVSFLKDLTLRYNKKTFKSKQYAASSRSFMADPRVVSGFKPVTKELVYPIVINKSKGSKLWDIDGNQYLDALNGFGSNMLGYQPDVIKEAMHEQIEKGYEVGPQHELASEVSKLICDFTSFERAALCSTGSEAVLGCIRIARTVTSRSLIVAFSGSYHGIIDEVLVRGTKKLKSFPAAAGIMPEAVQNILILDYGTPETLAIIKERGDEIAAVLVEPIQSRRPEFVPIEFLKELRTITKATGAVLIFDEVITGFRFHPGGAQAIFNIKADLAAYGKVVGGGIPIGVIAGDSYLMDALDGGNWNYGDESIPEIGVTYFAGTFVRHPLALASAYASLKYMKEKGPELQKSLNTKGEYLSKKLNEAIEKRQLPMFIANYGSLWKLKYHQELPYSELLFVLLRIKGIHILDGFPCFITEATSNDDIEMIINAFVQSLDEMIEAGFFPSLHQPNQNYNPLAVVIDSSNPPFAGAKLGKDKEGNPAWFIKDPSNEHQYLQLGDKIN